MDRCCRSDSLRRFRITSSCVCMNSLIRSAGAVATLRMRGHGKPRPTCELGGIAVVTGVNWCGWRGRCCVGFMYCVVLCMWRE